MYKNVKPIFFKALSGIHAGSGADLGLVDMPIQRERHSGLPKIESSSVKGCIREEFEQTDGLPADFVKAAFGPDSGKYAGSIAFTDARLLLFPVRSAKGVFAYATCPYILKRLAEDFALAGIVLDLAPDIGKDGKAQVSSDQLLVGESGKALLEEYTIEAEQTGYAQKLAENIAAWLKLEDPKYVQENLIILADDDLRDFAQNNTEIISRSRIDSKTGTVLEGKFFTEESLPAETVMYSLVMTSAIFMSEAARQASATVIAAGAGADEGKYLLDTIAARLPRYIQLGGDATIGKGLCRISLGV
ncbi:MAG: type III-B CRISPR module RAMP protein Cmr4 [Peptococcaceae bacterium]|jgi:CRISPR-associated protein Cmr4|nr:type III-B CRISPR module RAMP protein Cmr4 [Peptococcaceae bacterium]